MHVQTKLHSKKTHSCVWVRTLTHAGALVGERQRLPALAGGAAQCAGAGVRAAVHGAHGRAGHAAGSATHAMRAQLRVQHAALVAAAADTFAAAYCKCSMFSFYAV